MKHFEFTTPIFKNFSIDGKPYPCKIGEWTIEGIADITNANNLDFTWHLLSMNFKKSEFEQHEISYEDFYLSEETLSEIISQHLHSNYANKICKLTSCGLATVAEGVDCSVVAIAPNRGYRFGLK